YRDWSSDVCSSDLKTSSFCTWELNDDVFFLGDGRGEGPKTAYRVRRAGEKRVLEGLRDVGPDGKDVGDASGERIVLMQGRARASQRVDRANEHARHSAGPDLTQERERHAGGWRAT